MRKLLMVDASAWAANKLSELLHGYYQVYTTSAPQEVFELAERIHPEVLVLDIMLPGLDGVELLRMLRLSGLRPVTIVTTLYAPETTLTVLEELGVRSVFVKPFLLANLVSRIMELDGPASVGNGSAQGLLLKLGFRPDLRGHRILLEALQYVVEHPECSMTKELYPQIAKKLNTTRYHVERACRDCIAKAWTHRDRFLWSRFFPQSRVLQTRPLSNAVFLYRIAAWVREDGTLNL